MSARISAGRMRAIASLAKEYKRFCELDNELLRIEAGKARDPMERARLTDLYERQRELDTECLRVALSPKAGAANLADIREKQCELDSERMSLELGLALGARGCLQ